MALSGLDPERAREMATAADTTAERLEWHGNDAKSHITAYDLDDFGSSVASLCTEVFDELGDLALLARAKADQIEGVANGGAESPEIAALIDRLEASLGDDIGAQALEDPKAAAKRRADLEKWVEENPDFSADDFADKMEEVAETGDKEALTFLSDALWVRTKGMEEGEAAQFYRYIGPEAIMIATELTDPPERQALTDVMVLWAQAPEGWTLFNGASWSSEFLWTQLGIDSTRYDEWFGDKLRELSKGNPEVATLIFNSVENVANSGLKISDRPPSLGETIRQIAREHSDEFALQFEFDGRGQNLTDLMVVGADADTKEGERIRDDLSTFQLDFAGFCDRADPPADLETYGRYYRFMEATGHGIGYDYSKFALNAGASVLNTWTLGGAGAVLSVQDLVIPDEIAEARDNSDRLKADQFNAAFAVLSQRDPITASRIAREFGVDEPGQITEQMVLDLPKDLFVVIDEVREELEEAWDDPSD